MDPLKFSGPHLFTNSEKNGYSFPSTCLHALEKESRLEKLQDASPDCFIMWLESKQINAPYLLNGLQSVFGRRIKTSLQEQTRTQKQINENLTPSWCQLALAHGQSEFSNGNTLLPSHLDFYDEFCMMPEAALQETWDILLWLMRLTIPSERLRSRKKIQPIN